MFMLDIRIIDKDAHDSFLWCDVLPRCAALCWVFMKANDFALNKEIIPC